MGEQTNRDLVLAPGEYAFMLDTTKGRVSVLVGPFKTSPSQTDQTVLWDQQTGRYKRVELDRAVQSFVSVPEGHYVRLTNPAATDNQHPEEGKSNDLVKIQTGRLINVPGPAYFALWPGQSADVIPGHLLRSNEYLVVSIYNEEQARANWTRGVVKPQTQVSTSGEEGESKEGEKGASQPQPKPVVNATVSPESITMGQRFIVEGTKVSFYIPPTGVEVVRDANGKLVRDAVTLERLEYCILLDENGNKRYVQGPAVVFPKPTETFVEMKVETKEERKFRAIELNELSGIYVKVIADYKEGDTEYKAGQELFITGSDTAIYYPRPEHAIIKYGDREKHYAIAVPAGEGRYVLDRNKGDVDLAKGPAMLLPDPRTQVIVRRILDQRKVELWFPGNAQAAQVNRELRDLADKASAEDLVASYGLDRGLTDRAVRSFRAPAAPAKEAFAGDKMDRGVSYTPPRTITLDTKYDGAVSIDVWTGYAVMVVSKTGERRVVVGPATILLEYDETLMPMELSTDTPKSDKVLMGTVYLRVLNNRVSDLVKVETKDLCQVEVTVSYRVNFEGDKGERWFSVENYVKFLTDHLRSLIRNAVKGRGIEEFYGNAANIIRDAVLGLAKGDEKRQGRAFPENGMRVYDVEVLDVKINNPEIAKLLTTAQHEAVQQALRIARQERELDFTKRDEDIKRQMADERTETVVHESDLKKEELEKRLELNLAEISAETERERTKRTAAIEREQNDLEAQLSNQQTLDALSKAGLEREKAKQEQALTLAKREIENGLEQMRAQTEDLVKRTGAVTPDLIAALQAFGDKDLILKATEALAPLMILKDEGVKDLLPRFFKGTGLEGVIAAIGQNGGRSSHDRSLTS